MPWFYFGSDSSSWALGNVSFALANNLPPNLQSLWDELGEPYSDKSNAGTQIQWMSTTVDDRYVVMSTKGTLYTNDDALLATVKANLQMFCSVEYAALSPLGGFFIRFSDSTVIISGKWPDKFMNLASQKLDIYNTGKQVSTVERVWCVGDQHLMKTTHSVHWDGIPQAMADTITEFTTGRSLSETLHLGPNTVLCPWSQEYWMIEAMPAFQGTTQYPFALPDKQIGEEVLMHVIIRRSAPPPHLHPKTYRRGSQPIPPPPPPSGPAAPPKPNATPTYLPPTYENSAPQPPPQQRAPQHTPPAQSNNPFLTAEHTASSTISEGDRQRFGAQFDYHARGQSYISGTEAAVILMETGLDTRTLAGIWELIDVDKNGKLDREEFVAAMWHVESRQQGMTPTYRETPSGLNCDGCTRGIGDGEEVFYCAVCNGGDFDLCPRCHLDPMKRCHHQLQKLTVKVLGTPQAQEPAYQPVANTGNSTFGVLEIPGTYAYCDGCYQVLNVGTVIHWCSICSGGDYEICETCFQRGNFCGHTLQARKLVQKAPEPVAGGGGGGDDVDKLSKQFGDTKLKESLMSSIITEKPNIKWDDVAGLEAAKAELQAAIIFPTQFPHLFRGKRKPPRGILLYGPPGTGKSYLAKAVATEIDQTLFSISSGDIMSKWQGESEGLMRQLFKLAREKKPSIIFIDEIDALCSNRDSGSANAEDTARIKTEFLVQMDGLGNDNEGVFLLGATNLPWALDPAVRRRFQKRIHAPLPDEKARGELFKVHLGEMSASLGNTEWAYRDLAMRTNGFSGSDIANLVQDALMIPIKKIHTATHFKKFRDRQGEWFTPCNPGDMGAMPMKWSQVPGRQLKEPPLVMGDLYDAVSKVKPSVGQDEVQRCHEWTEQYGMEGSG